jgi:DDE family transposase
LIELCATVFDWAEYRRTKGAVKLHRCSITQGLLPSYAVVSEGRVHESRVAGSLRFEPGTTVVLDRGFTDYAWLASLDADRGYFVTRMKDNADYGVLERRPVPERGPVQRDEIVFLYKLAGSGGRDLFLRRVAVGDQEQHRTLVFLTNHRTFAASTIAIYRQR